MTLVGAIEAGGTKIVCAVGSSWSEIHAGSKLVIPTLSPEETMPEVVDWFIRQSEGRLEAIGVASFGPLDFTSGCISVTSPKTAWRGFNWRSAFKNAFPECVVALGTDTDAAGIAESRWGASRGHNVSVYITVGTGIGGSLLINGDPVHGIGHPEMGHMRVPRRVDDDFAGSCLSHGDCLEGLASGTALEQRWGTNGSDLPSAHPAWEFESDYLALALTNLVATCSPGVIVLGGGVMSAEGLIEKVRGKMPGFLGDYFSFELLDASLDSYVARPLLGSDAGVIGAFALGLDAQSGTN
jgi:fructokinase